MSNPFPNFANIPLSMERKGEEPYGHYFRSVAGLEKIDAYRIIDLYDITDPCLGHALKKILCAGRRGAKDAAVDVQEAIASLRRWQAMQVENAAMGG